MTGFLFHSATSEKFFSDESISRVQLRSKRPQATANNFQRFQQDYPVFEQSSVTVLRRTDASFDASISASTRRENVGTAIDHAQDNNTREKRRDSKLRHKVKKEKIKLEIQQLHHEIEALRQGIVPIVPAKSSFWNVVVDYFRIFRHGIQIRAPCSDQSDFLRQHVSANMVYNTGFGPGDVIRNWIWFQWFGHFDMSLKGLQQRGTNSMEATTMTRVTITDRTLDNVFPHLAEPKTGKVFTLREKLLGQEIVVHGTTHFEWDVTNGRLARVMAESDMLTPMLRLLGNYDDVVYVFENALVSVDFQWR